MSESVAPTNTSTSTPGKTPASRKPAVRKVHGRMLRTVVVAEEQRDPTTNDIVRPAVRKLFWFELQADGLHVRPFRSRRKKERVWSLAKLANGASGVGQMNLFV